MRGMILKWGEGGGMIPLYGLCVKKTVYDRLVAKVNSIDTSGFVLKTNYDTDKK